MCLVTLAITELYIKNKEQQQQKQNKDTTRKVSFIHNLKKKRH